MTRPALTLLLGVLLLALTPSSAWGLRSQYCSPSGDLCYGVVGGSPLRLRITLAAVYFTRYRLCVTSPDRQRSCRRFRVREVEGGVFQSTVRWSRHFPRRGHGTYRVRWLVGGDPLGPAVGFRRRSARPSISVFPVQVRAGGRVRVYGSAGGCARGNSVILMSEAFPEDDEFAGVPAVQTPVRAGSLYNVSVRIPGDRRPGDYRISARCGGGNFGVARSFTVLPAN
jgi:hypothetical protein